MKKILVVLILMMLLAAPVFAKVGFQLGYALGYPLSGPMFRLDLSQFSIDSVVGMDYRNGMQIGYGTELYGLYNVKISDMFDFRTGVGIISRLGAGAYFAPAGQIGFQFNIPNSVFAPFVKGNFGYDIGNKAFFWEATGGVFCKLW